MITKYLHKATLDQIVQGLTWYDEAHFLAQSLSKESGYTLEQCAGVISATSINQSWGGNVTLAKLAVKGIFKGMKQVVDKVQRILQAVTKEEILAILNGDKVKAFFLNILGDFSHVTIDRWMARMWGEERVPKGPKYKRYASKIKELATKNGYQPAQFQAILWLSIRNNVPNNNSAQTVL